MVFATQPGLLEQLEDNNKSLDEITKCLEAYLDTKRLAFSRFFFLSNDELLEILAQVSKFCYEIINLFLPDFHPLNQTLEPVILFIMIHESYCLNNFRHGTLMRYKGIFKNASTLFTAWNSLPRTRKENQGIKKVP